VQDIETADKPAQQLRVNGRAAQVAMVVGAALLFGALWAGKIDLDSVRERNSDPLDILSAGYKVLIVGGLLIVARRTASTSFKLLAGLVAALTVGSVVVNAGAFGERLYNTIGPLADSLPVSAGFVGLAFIFLALAAIAGSMVFASYVVAEPHEQSAVIIVIALLFLVGLFVGPVNAISAIGINREWLFAEDFGQVVTLSLLGGYTAGLVVATRQ